MFSFFKRFKGSKAPDAAVEESAEARESAVPEAPAAAPPSDPAPLPAATPAQSAAQPAQPAASAPVAAAEARKPEPEFEPEPEETALEAVEIVPPPVPEPAAKKSWLTRLKTGLSKTSSSLTGIFVGARIDEDLYEELEAALLMSDAGVEATEFLLESLREKVRAERLTDPQQVKSALRTLLVDLLKPLEKSLMLGRAQPLVMMIAGVNGAGKTTSIGKLAKHLQRFDQSVLLAAGDTFRAAAREQLAIWGERNNVTVVSQESGDPAAVIFDAVGAARARKIDVLMADTAGRLPTQLHLMEELRKVKRVIGKALDGAPHEVLLVIDANTGQNALAQVKAFDDALGLTGLIVTKLDGTAKGGILAAIARQRPVPVYFIGVGEKVEDLQPFSAEEFADALLDN
ncbi:MULTISPECIES: signal recognition particle-docking protein FtsY [Paraburkholderia]|uniref:signal recognition particle-docking protein FtsY n=1 Tax=Paraburkholderia TaxID=1822464 RepID=UPI002250E580|nr:MULTISPECIES: signal recognition particle-docking protein FtsY [Paraburkholderia]MCX4160511.1 signal recognition particle-docking protein FtsY [Paraburkholderia megapolitana]MDN7156009.1 signal recognition particle-docking protein FtsY [Paraburkholderia sp. CHISQ3]MDQ6493053.1 signal recognition particle-docking protein FtsY [Paraburkholderia megapolitana]